MAILVSANDNSVQRLHGGERVILVKRQMWKLVGRSFLVAGVCFAIKQVLFPVYERDKSASLYQICQAPRASSVGRDRETDRYQVFC